MSYNKWLYSLSNPVNYTDPSGYCARRAQEIIAANGSSGFLKAAEYCVDWFSGSAQGYEGSGWGYGLRQWVATQILCLDGDAENLIILGMLSLFQFDNVRITGQALEKIKHDPALVAFENVLVSRVQADPRFGETSFSKRSLGDSEDLLFGGERTPGEMLEQAVDPFDGLWRNRDETVEYFTLNGWGSVNDILDPAKNPLHLTYIDTWRVAFNELSWITRHASVKAVANVQSNGRMRIRYLLTDRLNLRPEGDRGFEYNTITTILGLLYHDFVGGNDQLSIYATWHQDR
jgi:hypothetical protein